VTTTDRAADRPAIAVCTAATGLTDPAEVEQVYAAASAPPPLAEPPAVARMYAELYAHTRHTPGLVAVTAHQDGELVGFGYGHPWSWAANTDGWSAELADRLGAAAAATLEGSFAVQLLAVAPEAAGAGLGRRLLGALLAAAGSPRAWLVTSDVDSPARRLYASTGWRELGRGPAAPNGAPALVLVRHRPDVALSPVDVRGADRPALIEFLVDGPWPFHVRSHPTREQVSADVDGGRYDDDAQALWVLADGERVGLGVLEDLADDTPMLDLRLAPAARGRGLGLPALRALTDHLFATQPARRFEAQTREDNVAMRRVLLRAGFVKEAHYREGWPVEGGPALASVGYAVLRRDWVSGTTTPLVWDDLTR